jgi:hypothetical protein
MYYVDGGGTEHDGGLWHIFQTDRSTTFTCVEEPFFDLCCPSMMKLKHDGEFVNDWQDGSFTVYPHQSGTPHIFDPIVQQLALA